MAHGDLSVADEDSLRGAAGWHAWQYHASPDSPQQNNGSNCGIYCILSAACLSARRWVCGHACRQRRCDLVRSYCIAQYMSCLHVLVPICFAQLLKLLDSTLSN